MQNTEPETKYREHTLDKLLGQFEQLDEQHRQLTREEGMWQITEVVSI